VEVLEKKIRAHAELLKQDILTLNVMFFAFEYHAKKFMYFVSFHFSVLNNLFVHTGAAARGLVARREREACQTI